MKDKRNYKYLFGPVPSRRLGLSLGVDLVRAKTCTLDCVYCESGATTVHTLERSEMVPVAQVIAELSDFLRSEPELDYITFSGAGEPTLNSEIGEVVEFVKREYPSYKLCLLTNATLFNDPALLADIRNVDLIVPSLDASDENEFSHINRPCAGLTFDMLISGLHKMREVCRSEIWLEIFIVPTVNDSDESIGRFSRIIRQLKPHKVQINTLDRPGVEDWVCVSPPENTMRFIKAFEPFVGVEVVGSFRYRSDSLKEDIRDESQLRSKIIELVSRRPCTAEDMLQSFRVDEQFLQRTLDKMFAEKSINTETRQRGIFYNKLKDRENGK